MVGRIDVLQKAHLAIDAAEQIGPADRSRSARGG
jgi:hypothetical protein